MKKWLILTGVLVVLFVGGYLFLSFHAVKLIQTQLQKVTGPGLTVTEIRIRPTYLSARGIRYEEPDSKRRILDVEEMRIYPDLFSFLKGPFEIRKWVVVQPSLYFYRSREGTFVGPWPGARKEGEAKAGSEGKEGADIHLKIGRLRIQKGSVDFEDQKVGEPPAQIGLRDLDFEIQQIEYPLQSGHSPIELKAKMKGRTKEGSVDAKGWIDLKTTDMETELKIRDVEVRTFEPYYRKGVTAEIQTGTVDMETKIAVKRRMIDAPGQLELVDLRLNERGTVFFVPARTLVPLLKDKGNRIKVRFRVNGNMDDPQFNVQEAFLTRVGISLAEALGVPIKVVGETIFKGTEKGAGGLVEGLKSIERLFKRRKE